MTGLERLAFEVIVSAKRDLKSTHLKHCKSARDFFEGYGLDFWCEYLDIEPDKIRRKLELGEYEESNGA